MVVVQDSDKEDEDEIDGGFDDSLDQDRVPDGYGTAFDMRKTFETNVNLSMDEMFMMRTFPTQRKLTSKLQVVVKNTRTFTDDNGVEQEIVDTGFFLRSIMTPKRHRAELFVTS